MDKTIWEYALYVGKHEVLASLRVKTFVELQMEERFNSLLGPPFFFKVQFQKLPQHHKMVLVKQSNLFLSKQDKRTSLHHQLTINMGTEAKKSYEEVHHNLWSMIGLLENAVVGKVFYNIRHLQGNRKMELLQLHYLEVKTVVKVLQKI